MPVNTDSPATALLDKSIAGYRVAQQLGDASQLCLAAGDRRVVLKPLDAECVINGKLHPSVKDRLGRVRELAHGGVANLYCVEKDAHGHVWLVWEYVTGETLADFIASQPTPRELCVVLREALLAIETIHGHGIVHGAIHERNIIVDSSRQVRLTHVSPHLYTDTGEDELSVVEMMERLGSPPYDTIALAATQSRESADVLRTIRGKLAAMIDLRESPVSSTPTVVIETNSASEKRSRRWPVLAAMVVLLVGAALTYGIAKGVLQQGAPTETIVKPIAR